MKRFLEKTQVYLWSVKKLPEILRVSDEILIVHNEEAVHVFAAPLTRLSDLIAMLDEHFESWEKSKTPTYSWSVEKLPEVLSVSDEILIVYNEDGVQVFTKPLTRLSDILAMLYEYFSHLGYVPFELIPSADETELIRELLRKLRDVP